MRRISFLFLFAIAVAGLPACNDPHSQKRIQSRVNHLNIRARDLGKRDADGARRMREAGETVDKWWKYDCKRFKERAPTVGDYIW